MVQRETERRHEGRGTISLTLAQRMETPGAPEIHETRVYSVISGPVNLEAMERALVGAYPGARTRIYYSQAGSRELHIESDCFDFEAYNLDTGPDSDSSFNGVVRGEQQGAIDSVQRLFRTIEATGHSVAFEIYGPGDEVLFEQQGGIDKR